MKIKVNQLLPNPEQPRLVIDQGDLESLADSIREHGLLNPIAVEGPQEDGKYYIIDGERRWRAHQLIGLDELECNVRPALNGSGKVERLLLGIIGNLQRQDMNLIERATCYKRLFELGMNYSEIGRAVKMTSGIISANILLLDLPLEIQRLYAEKKLPFDVPLVKKFLEIAPETSIRIARRAAHTGMPTKRILWLLNKLPKGFVPEKRKDRERTEKYKNNRVFVAMSEFGSHWNALAQVRMTDKTLQIGEQIQEAAKETCKACALYDDASQNVCRDCPAVELIRRLVL